MSRAPTEWTSDAMHRRVRARYRSERRFRLIGLGAVLLSVGFLAFLLLNMAANGLGGFMETRVKVAIDFPHSNLLLDPAALKGLDAQQALAGADIEGTVAAAAQASFGPDGADLISEAAWLRVRDAIAEQPEILQTRKEFWLPASSALDGAAAGEGKPELIQSYRKLKSAHAIDRGFNGRFLTGSD
ncbi:MAG TPA: DUF3333 domain-containing protein, partial [Allosphingosinicella sp.]|nr:DUF3333 domain-containing protein [Allosphingosinicella sp.]